MEDDEDDDADDDAGDDDDDGEETFFPKLSVEGEGKRSVDGEDLPGSIQTCGASPEHLSHLTRGEEEEEEAEEKRRALAAADKARRVTERLRRRWWEGGRRWSDGSVSSCRTRLSEALRARTGTVLALLLPSVDGWKSRSPESLLLLGCGGRDGGHAFRTEEEEEEEETEEAVIEGRIPSAVVCIPCRGTGGSLRTSPSEAPWERRRMRMRGEEDERGRFVSTLPIAMSLQPSLRPPCTDASHAKSQRSAGCTGVVWMIPFASHSTPIGSGLE